MTKVRVICKCEDGPDADIGVHVWLKASDVPVSLLPGDEYEFEVASGRGVAIVEETDPMACPVEWR